MKNTYKDMKIIYKDIVKMLMKKPIDIFTKNIRGDIADTIIIGAAIVVLVILPVMAGVIEKWIFAVKVQQIKDALDLSNLSVYYSLNIDQVSRTNIDFDSTKGLTIFKEYIAANLNLNNDLTPKYSGSIAEGQVVVKSFIIYTSGFPRTCPQGKTLTRPTIHSYVTVPVKPSLYSAIILNALGVETIDLDVHEDTEIPVNN